MSTNSQGRGLLFTLPGQMVYTRFYGMYEMSSLCWMLDYAATRPEWVGGLCYKTSNCKTLSYKMLYFKTSNCKTPNFKTPNYKTLNLTEHYWILQNIEVQNVKPYRTLKYKTSTIQNVDNTKRRKWQAWMANIFWNYLFLSTLRLTKLYMTTTDTVSNQRRNI